MCYPFTTVKCNLHCDASEVINVMVFYIICLNSGTHINEFLCCFDCFYRLGDAAPGE